MSADDLAQRGNELRPGGAREHDAVEVAVAGGHAQRLVERVGDDDHVQAGGGAPDANQRAGPPTRRIEACIEHEHVRRGARELAQQRWQIAGRAHDVEAEIVEQPAEGLGQQRAVVGYDYTHVMSCCRTACKGGSILANGPENAWGTSFP